MNNQLSISTFLNMPTIFKEKIAIYPPTVLDVAKNESMLNAYTTALCTSQEEIIDLFTPKDGAPSKIYPSPFEYLILNCLEFEEFRKIVEDAFLFFCRVPVMITPSNIVIISNVEAELSELKTIEPDDFFDFQNQIRISVGLEPQEIVDPDEDPFVAKIKANRRKAQKLKAKQGGGGISLSESVAAICCMGIGLTPLNIGEMSYANISVLINKHQRKDKYDTDKAAILAGADAKKIKLKDWIGN